MITNMKNSRDTDSHGVSDFIRLLTEYTQGDADNQGFGLGFHRPARVVAMRRPRDGYSARRSTRMDALECWPRGYPAHDDL